MPSSHPLTSDGSDPIRGGVQCLGHHSGVRTGIIDWCCCCNPCLYDRAISLEHPCRCIPKLICFVFKGDIGQRACCNEMLVVAFAVTQKITTYTANFPGGVDISLIIGMTLPGNSISLPTGAQSPAWWRLKSTKLGIDQTYVIDHVHTTCLTPPSVAISGVTIPTPSGPCVGTITMETYKASKLRFKRRSNLSFQPPNSDIAIPYPPCNCGFAVDTLCVWGRRKLGGSYEGVTFKWDAALGDRWSYTSPCALSSTLAQEHIYLRGDAYGKCWLELDFTQAGSTTNDWADPPNTFDSTQPYNIRPGMLPIESCTCGLAVRATSTGGRDIAITAGYCEKYSYSHCGTCRCVPDKLCIVASIDGTIFQGQATWDGTKWVSGSSPYMSAFSLNLTTGDCDNIAPPKTDIRKCAIQATGTFIIPFEKGAITECGPRLSFQLASKFNPAFPNVYNWMIGRASPCGGCKDITCGPCREERCGGPPDVLYADLEAVISRGNYLYGDPANPIIWTDEICNIQVRMIYYQMWQNTNLICGYIGTATLPGGGTFQLQWHQSSTGIFEMTRITSLGVTKGIATFTFPYAICEPFLWISNWNTGGIIPSLNSYALYCAWGTDTQDSTSTIVDIKYRVTLTE